MELEYNEEIHIKSLYDLLSLEKPCSHCPALIHIYNTFENVMNIEIYGLVNLISTERINTTAEEYLSFKEKACVICRSFIDMNDVETPMTRNPHTGYVSLNCPCNMLGKGEAIKRTWIKLEKIEEDKSSERREI